MSKKRGSKTTTNEGLNVVVVQAHNIQVHVDDGYRETLLDSEFHK